MKKLTKTEEFKISHDYLLSQLKGFVKCIRNFELGDYSPLMDEIFDSENAIKKAEKLNKKYGK